MTPEDVYEFLGPFIRSLDGLLDKIEKDVISINDFLSKVGEVLDLQSSLKRFFAPLEVKEKLIIEVLKHLAVTDYDLSPELFDKKYPISKFYEISKNWIYTMKLNGKYMTTYFNKDKITLEGVFETFKYIEDNLTDKKNLERALLEYFHTTTEYDNYEMQINGNNFTVGFVKQYFSDPLVAYPKDPFESYFKLASFLLNGITDESQYETEPDMLLKDINIKDFNTAYGSGTLLYLSKLILAILDAYVILEEKGTEEEKALFYENIKDTTVTATNKAKEAFRLLFKYTNEPLNIEYLIKMAYYLPVTDEFYKLFDNSNTEYQYYDDRKDEIKDETGREMDEILIDMLLKEKAEVVMPKFIALNQSILTKMKKYQEEIPEIFAIVMKDINFSLFMSQLVQMYAFPDSLGKINLTVFKDIIELVDNSKLDAISIYVDGGRFESPYYNFYYDDAGEKKQIDFSTFSLQVGETYKFMRLDNAVSHPVWIREIENVISDRAAESRGIIGSEYFQITIPEGQTEIEIYCTSHAIMVAKLAIDSSLSPVPCFTDTCSILTPHGYVEVNRLKEGDLVMTPEKKEVKITKIMKPKTLAVNGKTRPHLIPKHSIKPNVPFKDTYISLNHGYMENDQWKVPGKNMEANQVQWSSDSVTYYNIMLEDYPNHDLVVNGVTMECWGGANAQDSFGQENIPIRNKKLFG